MKRTIIDYDVDNGFHFEHEVAEWLTPAQKVRALTAVLALVALLIVSLVLVTLVKLVGVAALLFLGGLALLVWLAVLIIHGRKAEEEHYLNMWGK